MVSIDTLYNIDDDVMDASRWKALDAVYRQLPKFVAYENHLPFWFGTDASSSYLYASVEPPGLQVAGVLAEEDWERWNSTFKALASEALGFEVKNLAE